MRRAARRFQLDWLERQYGHGNALDGRVLVFTPFASSRKKSPAMRNGGV